MVGLDSCVTVPLWDLLLCGDQKVRTASSAGQEHRARPACKKLCSGCVEPGLGKHRAVSLCDMTLLLPVKCSRWHGLAESAGHD